MTGIAETNNALISAVFGPGIYRVRSGFVRSRPQSGADVATQLPPVPDPRDTDQVEFSQAGRAAAAASLRDSDVAGGQTNPAAQTTNQELSPEAEAEVRELKKRDAEVRRHEAAHKAAAGSAAPGGPSFQYTTGPDNKRYAVSGEVAIDASEVAGDPQATIAKMQRIRRAASAPAQPSGADRRVAAQAAVTEREARAELAKERRAEASSTKSPPSSDKTKSTTASPDAAQPGSPMSALAAQLRGGHDMDSRFNSPRASGLLLDLEA